MLILLQPLLSSYSLVEWNNIVQDYAKTDGLEYICPRCTAGNGKPNPRRVKPKRSPETSNSPPTDPVIKTQKRN